ncbi:virulence factor MviN [Rhodopseudomonas boonkerdii]|uniref:murein biosynthesis integral membrane protein MurJ n=1 Tax=Rhodopseudomonas boonkerdii TaxID=475937 RepID=UPI001E4CCB5A|nr:lipid II flippase MurJ [Rhodopseudomonas boonkerdii]UGV25294.1 virulence factor MviN [Rhodopseudomonas boonkerdii]
MTAPRQSTGRFVAKLISGALASKLLGFGREILMAHVLGATLVADGFRGAITAVFLPVAFLQNETVPAVMIPMHRDALRGDDAPRKLGALAIATTGIALILMAVLQGLGEVAVQALVGGFSPEGRSLTLDFIRIMALGMPASVLVNVLASGEIALGRTRLTNIRASILNISVLVGIVLIVLTSDFHALAWSFTVAFNALAIWGLVTLRREGAISFRDMSFAAVLASSREFFRRLRPLLALPIAEQANIWVERLLASRVGTGAVASLDYARTLTESALLLISQPVGLAVLSSAKPKEPSDQIASIARPILALAVPASAFLFMFAPDIVRLVFFRGAFNEQAVILTSQALQGISCGLWAATLGWILIRILNGTGRNFVAALIIVIAYLVNIGINLLTSYLPHVSESGTLLLGLGEATRGIVLLAGVMMVLKSRKKLLFWLFLASIPAVLMILSGWQIHAWFAGSWQRLFVGSVACLVCIALAFAMLLPNAYVAAFARLRSRF